MSETMNPKAQELFDEAESALARLKAEVLDHGNDDGPGGHYEAFEKATVLAFGNWVLDFLGLDGDSDVTMRVKRARRQLVESLSRGMPEVVMGPDDMLGQGYDIFNEEDLEKTEDELGVAPVQLTAE